MGMRTTWRKDRGFGGRPNRLLAFGVRTYLWFWFLRHAPVYDRTALRGLSGPYILLVNHPSNLDAFLLGRGFDPTRTNYVASQYFFRFPILKFLLGQIGAIPKSHSAKDVQALRMMLKSLAAGRILVVFPEGRRSLEGRGSRFSEAMAKMAKKSGLPVVAAVISGSYLVWPRWAEKPGVGPLSVRFNRVLSPDELSVLSVADIHARMHKALQFDEYAMNRLEGRHYRSKDRTGMIERLLHVCPDCRNREAIVGDGQDIRCTLCGAGAVMDDTGLIRRTAGKGEPWPQVPEWFDLQRRVMAGLVRDDGCRVEAEVLRLGCAPDPNKPMTLVGSGQISLSRDGLTFTGMMDGAVATRFFPIALMDMLPVSLGKHFEICDETGTYWQFFLSGASKVIQFEQVSDIFLYGEEAP